MGSLCYRQPLLKCLLDKWQRAYASWSNQTESNKLMQRVPVGRHLLLWLLCAPLRGLWNQGWPLASFRARCPSSRYNKSEKKEARGTGCAPPLKAGQSSPSYQLFESILLCPNHGKMTWLAQGTAKPDHTVGDNLPKTAEPTLDMTCP